MSDLISRQAAIEAAKKIIGHNASYKAWAILGRLFELPSAQPERKTGRWVYNETFNIFGCSVCGGEMVRNIFNYCPWCGAKMEVYHE